MNIIPFWTPTEYSVHYQGATSPLALTEADGRDYPPELIWGIGQQIELTVVDSASQVATVSLLPLYKANTAEGQYTGQNQWDTVFIPRGPAVV
jgi:hypothetical protein